MTEIINQCCYTHIGTWTAVAQKGFFEQKYIGELSRHSTLPGPEYGERLSVFETVGDGDKFLVMKTQYGLRDLSTESGRASMFSHGYILDTSAKPFDPNIFLTVSGENFCTNTEDAAKERDGLVRSERYTLSSAMAIAGLTRETFSKLVKCVYQLSVRSINKKALYIKSKDEAQSMALLYCIYSALIPCYGKFLSSASAEYNFSDMRNIVFSATVNTTKKYFIPETGENNVLSTNVDKNIDSLYFVDYGVKNFDTTEAIQKYFAELEKTLQKISGLKQGEDDVTRLAHVITVSPNPSKESPIVSDNTALVEVLQLAEEYNKKNQNEYVTQYIEKLQAEAISRKLLNSKTVKRPEKEFNYNVGIIDVWSDSKMPKASQMYNNKELYVSTIEKQQFKADLRARAEKGPESLLVLSDMVEKFLHKYYVRADEQTSKELATAICDALWIMILISINTRDGRAFIQNPLKLLEDWLSVLIPNQATIEKLKLEFKIKYWRTFNWETYSLRKNDDYSYFDFDATEKAALTENNMSLVKESEFINGITLLQKEGKRYDTENWLVELNKLCSENKTRYYEMCVTAIRKNITPYYEKFILVNSSKESYLNNEVVKRNTVALVAYLSEDEFAECLSVLKELFALIGQKKVSKKDRDSAEEKCLYDMIDFISKDFSSTQIKKSSAGLFYRVLLHFDEKKGNVVPFDYWLAVGTMDEKSPYSIFYKYDYEPAVMKTSAGSIVEDSKLLKDKHFQDLLKNESQNDSKFIKGLIKKVYDDAENQGKGRKGLLGRKKK